MESEYGDTFGSKRGRYYGGVLNVVSRLWTSKQIFVGKCIYLRGNITCDGCVDDVLGIL